MSITAKADGNVPFIGPRSRYSVIGTQPTTLIHKMALGNLDGKLPRTSAKTAFELDPSVSGGKATWFDLTEGGLFNFTGKAIVVEALSAGTWRIVFDDGGVYTVLRATPVCPFRLAPNEKLQIIGVAMATATVRLDIQKCI